MLHQTGCCRAVTDSESMPAEQHMPHFPVTTMHNKLLGESKKHDNKLMSFQTFNGSFFANVQRSVPMKIFLKINQYLAKTWKKFGTTFLTHIVEVIKALKLLPKMPLPPGEDNGVSQLISCKEAQMERELPLKSNHFLLWPCLIYPTNFIVIHS